MRQVIEPRGLTREQAAAYVGVSAEQFMKLVVTQRMPTPKRFGDQLRWDRHEIDRVIDATDAQLRNIEAWQSLIASVSPKPPEQPAPPAPHFTMPTPAEQKKKETVWRRTVRRTPLQKSEKVALQELFARRDGIRERDLPKGVTYRIKERLLARGYMSTTDEEPWGWSLWKITKRGIAAVENGEAKLD